MGGGRQLIRPLIHLGLFIADKGGSLEEEIIDQLLNHVSVVAEIDASILIHVAIDPGIRHASFRSGNVKA